MVQPILDRINIKESMKQVERHLESFSTISKMIAVTDLVNIPGSTQKQEKIGISSPSLGEKLLKKMELADNTNRQTAEYIKWICEKLNCLDAINRKIILSKYYYKMDTEEIEISLGLSKKMQYKLLNDAKIQLIFLMNEEVFEEIHL